MALSARTTRALSVLAMLFALSVAAFIATGSAKAYYEDEDCNEYSYNYDPYTGTCDYDPDDNGDGSDDWNTSPGDTPQQGPTGPVGEPDSPIWPQPPRGEPAALRQNGRTATIPSRAPRSVKRMIRAANSLTRKPYKWGGGHGSWKDSGYDCSGAVSYVLRAGGKLSWPMVSGALAKWGKKGEGKWVQVYAHKNHVFMVIAGLRFDTSGYGEHGPRWRTEPRGTKGFRLRHPAGL